MGRRPPVTIRGVVASVGMRLAHNEFVFGSAWLEVSTINAGCVHAFDKPIEVTGTSELQADEGGTSFPVVALEVFEEGDVVVGAENIAEEGPELAGFLGEIDEKVVLQAAVNERTFHHLGVAEQIVIAAGDDTNHNVIGAEFQLGQAVTERAPAGSAMMPSF